eukprot:1089321-Rhodomonas_salina.1
MTLPDIAKRARRPQPDMVHGSHRVIGHVTSIIRCVSTGLSYRTSRSSTVDRYAISVPITAGRYAVSVPGLSGASLVAPYVISVLGHRVAGAEVAGNSTGRNCDARTIIPIFYKQRTSARYYPDFRLNIWSQREKAVTLEV